jgi:hypothetical protein
MHQQSGTDARTQIISANVNYRCHERHIQKMIEMPKLANDDTPHLVRPLYS